MVPLHVVPIGRELVGAIAKPDAHRYTFSSSGTNHRSVEQQSQARPDRGGPAGHITDGVRMATIDTSLKQKHVLVRLSAIEHKRIRQEATRRGMSVSDLARSLFRVASGSLPVPAERGGGVAD